MPLFILWRESNDSQLERLYLMVQHLNYSAPIYHSTDGYVRVTKFSLERNSTEIRELANIVDHRFHEFTAVILISSAGIVALSVFVIKNCGKKNAA